MLHLILISLLAPAQLRIPKFPSIENTNLHKVIANGQTIKQPKNCIEEEIRKRTVMIFVDGRRNCTGVLIDAQNVALAGHCSSRASEANSRKIIKGPDAGNVTKFIYFDEEKRSYQLGPAVSAASLQFQGNAEAGEVAEEQKDMMVLRLSAPIPGVKPLRRVPASKMRTLDNQALVVAGFGLDENDKLGGNVKYLTAKGKVPSSTSSTVSAFPVNKKDRVKRGDSGGPVFRVLENTCELELVGITKGIDETPEGQGLTLSDSAENINGHIKELNNRLAEKNLAVPLPVPAKRPARQ